MAPLILSYVRLDFKLLIEHNLCGGVPAGVVAQRPPCAIEISDLVSPFQGSRWTVARKGTQQTASKRLLTDTRRPGAICRWRARSRARTPAPSRSWLG